MKWLAGAWIIAQLIALFTGNFLLFLIMVLIDAVWFVGAVLVGIANRQAPNPQMLSEAASIDDTARARGLPAARVAPTRPAPRDPDELWSEMQELVDVRLPDGGDEYGWQHFSLDFARMEYSSSGGPRDDDFVSEGEAIIRRTESGWEFKDLWTVSSSFGKVKRSQTPVDEVNEEFGVGTPKWDPELEAQYRRRVVKALSWQKCPDDLSAVIEKHYLAAVAFFQQHPGLYPRISLKQLAALKPGGPVWKPPVHSENAAPERFVLACTKGEDEKDFFRLRDRGLLMVGRSPDCQWQLHAPAMLERQFQLKVGDETVLFRDLGGGTAVNGETPGERMLVAGDVLTFAGTSVKVIERKSTPPEAPEPKKPREKSSFDIWAETYPDAARQYRQINEQAWAEEKPVNAAYKERMRPFLEQKTRAIAAAKAAYDDMVRPFREELDHAVGPLLAAYGKADSDLADEAARPFREKFHRATAGAYQMLRDAEKAANATYEAQVKPLSEAQLGELRTIRKKYDERRAAIMNSTKTPKA
jgi:hypothetical protein